MGADKGGNWTGGDKMGKYHIVACDKGLFVLLEERGGFFATYVVFGFPVEKNHFAVVPSSVTFLGVGMLLNYITDPIDCSR